jgi:catechol 2,3-dioxygenase-like lactoylglutathione lyase family enzyme
VPDVFAGLPVSDLDAARAWYERLTGAPPFMQPNDDEYVWQLEEHSWIYVVRDAQRAGNGLLTVLVDDLDDQIAELAERGLTTDPTETMGNGVRTAEIRDPAGNLIKFGQPPTQSQEGASP